MYCMRLAGNTGRIKVTILAPSHNFVWLYLRNYGTYRQSEKNFYQQYLLHISSQYGELRPTNGWDLLASLGHPCKFQRVSRLGSVNARHSSSGHQPNFAALNRGRHLYSAGRPSCWALAHISSYCCFTAKRHLRSKLITCTKCVRVDSVTAVFTLLYDRVLLPEDHGFQFHECTRSVNNNKAVIAFKLKTDCMKILLVSETILVLYSVGQKQGHYFSLEATA